MTTVKMDNATHVEDLAISIECVDGAQIFTCVQRIEPLISEALEASREAYAPLDIDERFLTHEWIEGRAHGVRDALGVLTGHYWYYDEQADEMREDETTPY